MRFNPMARQGNQSGAECRKGELSERDRGFLFVLLLIVVLILGSDNKAEDAKARLSLWASSVRLGKRFQKQACLLVLIILILSSLSGGFRNVLKGLLVLMISPVLALFRKYPQVFLDQDDQILLDPSRDIPILAKMMFLLVDKRNREAVIGDLEEEYRTIVVPVKNFFRARCWWWSQVLGIAGTCLLARIRWGLRSAMIRRLRRR